VLLGIVVNRLAPREKTDDDQLGANMPYDGDFVGLCLLA
jgi:hypothetical protein